MTAKDSAARNLRVNPVFRFAAIVSTLFAGPLAADSVEIVADRDATLYESATGAVANGAGARFFTGNTGQEEELNARRALIRFDVAGGLPPGSVITSVTLTLYLSRVNQDGQLRSHELHRVLADWGEGTSNAAGQEGVGVASTTNDATWIHRFYPSQLWGSSGGDFATTASASATVGTELGYESWTSAGMAADVQAWLDAPGSNYGWILIGEE